MTSMPKVVCLAGNRVQSIWGSSEKEKEALKRDFLDLVDKNWGSHLHSCQILFSFQPPEVMQRINAVHQALMEDDA